MRSLNSAAGFSYPHMPRITRTDCTSANAAPMLASAAARRIASIIISMGSMASLRFSMRFSVWPTPTSTGVLGLMATLALRDVRRRQPCVQLALRFSRNAAMPSAASSERNMRVLQVAVSSKPSAMVS